MIMSFQVHIDKGLPDWHTGEAFPFPPGLVIPLRRLRGLLFEDEDDIDCIVDLLSTDLATSEDSG